MFTTVCALGIAPSHAAAQTVSQLIPHRVNLESVTYSGKSAVRVIEDGTVPNGEAYATLRSAAFHNGTIEVELAGRPAAGAFADARGFVGVAFRVRDGTFEYIYLRPTNGRADDQVRRNHATQYSEFPDFGFGRLRDEAPGKYESYVDLEPGAWTRIRIVVEGATARLFVHDAPQPALVVTDLKLGDASGGVALWIGPGTEGYFRGLTIHPRPDAAATLDRASRIEQLMRELHRQHKFNGEILVAQRGTVIYKGGFGAAAPGSARDYTPDTPSCLASLSKPITALAVTMLVEEGRLAYDDRIATYVPELRHAFGDVTIRHLLTHTSGVPDYPSLNIDHPGMTNAEVLSGLRNVSTGLFAPGQKYDYSNSGYVLLGHVVEQVSGQSLPHFLEDRIFTPLRMKDTFVMTRPDQKVEGVARGYDALGRPDDYTDSVTGSTGVYSTVADLLKLDQALYTNALVSQEALGVVFTSAVVRAGQTSYGLGWNVVPDVAGIRVWHQGNTAGFRAFIERRLRERITVIMLTNGGDTDRMAINDAIQRILAE
jgi:CubicO group peptidase (beta-lactamase class C family)